MTKLPLQISGGDHYYLTDKILLIRKYTTFDLFNTDTKNLGQISNEYPNDHQGFLYINPASSTDKSNLFVMRKDKGATYHSDALTMLFYVINDQIVTIEAISSSLSLSKYVGPYYHNGRIRVSSYDMKTLALVTSYEVPVEQTVCTNLATAFCATYVYPLLMTVCHNQWKNFLLIKLHHKALDQNTFMAIYPDIKTYELLVGWHEIYSCEVTESMRQNLPCVPLFSKTEQKLVVYAMDRVQPAKNTYTDVSTAQAIIDPCNNTFDLLIEHYGILTTLSLGSMILTSEDIKPPTPLISTPEIVEPSPRVVQRTALNNLGIFDKTNRLIEGPRVVEHHGAQQPRHLPGGPKQPVELAPIYPVYATSTPVEPVPAQQSNQQSKQPPSEANLWVWECSEQIAFEYQTKMGTYDGTVKLNTDGPIRSLEKLCEIFVAGIEETNSHVVLTETIVDNNTIMMAFDIDLIFFKEWYPVTLKKRQLSLTELLKKLTLAKQNKTPPHLVMYREKIQLAKTNEKDAQ